MKKLKKAKRKIAKLERKILALQMQHVEDEYAKRFYFNQMNRFKTSFIKAMRESLR